MRVDQGVPPPIAGRYTYDGDAAVEARIEDDQRRIGQEVLAAVPSKHFVALVLIGGYGRGEGGFCLVDGHPAPYNDYDYFVVVRNANADVARNIQHTLAKLARTLEAKVGVEVDFALLHQERLPSMKPELMFAEMQWGHKVVAGEPDALASMPPMPFAELPLGEFGRLMLNRGALLLMNQEELARGQPTDAQGRERFIKYIFKSVLADGDALLAALRRYDPSYPRKLTILEERSDLPEGFLSIYRQALDQRFHPDYKRLLGADLRQWQEQAVAYWLEFFRRLEEARLGGLVPAWPDYASWRISKGQTGATPAAVARNLAITARDFGFFEWLRRPGWSIRYPRERLISVLPLLLAKQDECRAMIADALALDGTHGWRNLRKRFLALWKRYA